MDDLAGVEILDAPEYLVEEHLDVVSTQVLGGDNYFVQVRLHQLGDEVDFLEKVDVRWLQEYRVSTSQNLPASMLCVTVNYLQV